MAFQGGEHPRLLFTQGELPRLRSDAETGLKARVLARLREACREYMDPDSAEYLDFRERRKDTWRLRAGIFTLLPALEALATGYAFTGDPAVGDFARDCAMEIVDHGLADVKSKAWGSETEGWRHGPGHDKGKFAMALSWVYDFCYDRFSEQQQERFADFARESVKLSVEWWRFDWGQIANNRGVRGILTTTWYCLALEGDAEIEGAEHYLAEGETAIEHYLLNAYDASGAPFEGPGYGAGMGQIAAAAEAIRRRGGPNLLKNNRFERLPEYYLYELLPGGGLVNNLNDAELASGTVTCALHLMGTERGQLLPWLAGQLDLHPLRVGTWLEGRESDSWLPPGQALLYFLLWWRDDAPVRTPRELGYPLSRHFRDRGVVSMRTGWDKEDWLITHFCGRQQLKCHRQGDHNHVSFYALGEHFLVDAGYGHPRTDTTARVDRWFGETESHNCVLIDGMNQRGTMLTRGWGEGEMLDFGHTDDFDTSLGDASTATGRDHAVRRSLRRVVFVRRGPAPYLAVVDVNENDGERLLVECLWHTHVDNEIVLADQGFLIKGGSHDCVAQVLWPGHVKPAPATDRDRPQARVAVEAEVAETVTVFCPVKRGEEAPEFSCTRIGEGCFAISCRANGQESLLRLATATEGPLRQPLPVELEIGPS